MEKKTAKWWDKLGKPQYGGELVIRANSNIVDFDPYNAPAGNIFSGWMEKLVTDDWTMDPAVFDYKAHWRPLQYVKGYLAESWEFTDPNTYVSHLRKGIHWQNIPPANGREFVAEDVVFHFNRMCGLGGFPKSSFSAAFQDLVSVAAADKYTVVFKWRTANPMIIMEALHQTVPTQCIENPEAVRQWGDLNDWHHAVGTGPFILKDVVDGKSATLVKNHSYWGHDERYPKNTLPYLDKVRFVVMPDEAEAIAAMRLGKIDIIDHISPVQAYALQKTNPEILIMTHPDSNAFSIEPRNDTAPFNDIRVRKAMQMALDLPAISMYHYKGIVDPTPITFTLSNMARWEFPYAEWPQDLKDEYAYNPDVARKLLADAGYPSGFKTNVVADAASDMELMRIARSYFAQIGIDMEIREMESAACAEFVAKGHKHDQMAHRIVGPMGHTSAPMFDLTQYAKGGRNNWAMVNDAGFNSFLPRALATANAEDLRKLMREANEYVARQHFSICLHRIMAYSLCQPWVKGFNGQFGAAWAHGGGPAMLSFYLGRFWVDKKLKKSAGF